MKTPIRIIFLVFLFIGFFIPSSQAIIRTKSETSTPQYTVQKAHKKTFKERLTTYIVDKTLKKKFAAIDPSSKTTKTQKIINITIFSILGFVAVYLLQGTLWLTVVGLLALFLFLKHRKHQRHKNDPPPPPVQPKDQPSGDKPLVVDYKNSFSRKSMVAFLKGIGSLLGAFVTIFLVFLSTESFLAIIGFFAFLLLSTIWFISAISKAAKSIKLKEPDSDEAILWMVLSILLLLPAFLIILATLLSF